MRRSSFVRSTSFSFSPSSSFITWLGHNQFHCTASLAGSVHENDLVSGYRQRTSPSSPERSAPLVITQTTDRIQPQFKKQLPNSSFSPSSPLHTHHADSATAEVSSSSPTQNLGLDHDHNINSHSSHPPHPNHPHNALSVIIAPPPAPCVRACSGNITWFNAKTGHMHI